MKAIIQRVSGAQVAVENEITGKIDKGFLILLGVEQEDDETEARVLAKKIAGLRVFTDENDKMNLALSDIGGGTLPKNNSFKTYERGTADEGKLLVHPDGDRDRDAEENGVSQVEKGVFGADMQVSLVNDGPVTIDINSKDLKR